MVLLQLINHLINRYIPSNWLSAKREFASIENLSSQIVSGSWRLMCRLASSCTVQLVTSFIKAWTFLIFLGQAFQTFKKYFQICTVLSVWLIIDYLNKLSIELETYRNFHTWFLADNSTAAGAHFWFSKYVFSLLGSFSQSLWPGRKGASCDLVFNATLQWQFDVTARVAFLLVR